MTIAQHKTSSPCLRVRASGSDSIVNYSVCWISKDKLTFFPVINSPSGEATKEILLFSQ